MNRYNTTSIGTQYNGKRFLRTTRYPTIPLSSSDTYIIAASEDFLDILANKFYKDPTLWWIIAHANKIVGSMKPKVGQQLRIPGNVDLIIARFNRENSQ
jgi:nucleoid-associated protein YgaU